MHDQQGRKHSLFCRILIKKAPMIRCGGVPGSIKVCALFLSLISRVALFAHLVWWLWFFARDDVNASIHETQTPSPGFFGRREIHHLRPCRPGSDLVLVNLVKVGRNNEGFRWPKLEEGIHYNKVVLNPRSYSLFFIRSNDFKDNKQILYQTNPNKPNLTSKWRPSRYASPPTITTTTNSLISTPRPPHPRPSLTIDHLTLTYIS